ncbi:MAG TPA: alpha/beta hydrolase-fold protein [Pyrinomonadaceae bacterium]|nr:alpha/beta hydrolase-fold protein [Pyrinomonadaceae bacterium]
MKRLILLFGLLLVSIPASGQQVQKEITNLGGKARAYYLFVPDKLTKDHPAPLLLLLHGSGRNGFSLVDKWKDLAKKEGIILVGPDAINTQMWSTPVDGPDFLHDLITDLQSKYPIDAHRMYIFGHSAGACFALYMALYESEYFAATAIHAGALNSGDGVIVERAKRKIPIYIAVGTVDRSFPLADVRATRDMLNSNGFNAQLIEMPGHDHWYYDLAPKINIAAWTFLKEQKLADEPRYVKHSFR